MNDAWNENIDETVHVSGDRELSAGVLTIDKSGLVSADDARFVKPCRTVGEHIWARAYLRRTSVPAVFFFPTPLEDA